MASNSFGHLPLPLKCTGIPKLHGGGGEDDRTKDNKNNRKSHGGFLKSQSNQVSNYWKQMYMPSHKKAQEWLKKNGLGLTL
jgi:hypothetical protein